MDFSTVRTLRDEAEYEAALKAVRPYFDDEPDPGTPAAANFDALILLIEDYERRHYPIPRATPVEVLKFVMETNHYSRADLIEVIGSRARVSDLLNGRRDINLDQIRRISRAWHIPPAALIGDLAA